MKAKTKMANKMPEAALAKQIPRNRFEKVAVFEPLLIGLKKPCWRCFSFKLESQTRPGHEKREPVVDVSYATLIA